jgi:LCP family protein required for cell wall assembly
MTSLMRDTWVNLYNVGWAKLNAANVYGGPKLVMRTVNENFGMNISHYAMINMTGLAEVIDKLGGIELDVTKDEMRYVNKYMEPFIVPPLDTSRLKEYGDATHLTGNQAMAFARNRYLDSDYNRTERQRKVLTAIAGKLQQNNVLTIVNAVSALLPYVETNLDMATLVKLATVGLGADLSNIQQLRLPADGTFDSGMMSGTWSIRPDFKKNTQLLHDFLYGTEG